MIQLWKIVFYESNKSKFGGENIGMKAKEYQKIYQNIKEKAPLESGVQTLVYMFLFEIIKDTDYQLIVIDRMRKNTQFVTTTGISDLAIVSDEFKFAEEGKNNIISYVEVKGTDINLYNFEDQIKGQLLSCGRILCTNGSVWKYYDIKKYIERYSENDIDYIWAKNEYEKIKEEIKSLEEIERMLAIKELSCAYTKNSEYKKTYEREIIELKETEARLGKKLHTSLMNISWLQNVMDTPIIDIKIYDNDNFDVIKYMKLKSELYDVISTW